MSLQIICPVLYKIWLINKQLIILIVVYMKVLFSVYNKELNFQSFNNLCYQTFQETALYCRELNENCHCWSVQQKSQPTFQKAAFISVTIHTHIHTHTLAYTHIRIHTHKHTYTYAYTHRYNSLCIHICSVENQYYTVGKCL